MGNRLRRRKRKPAAVAAVPNAPAKPWVVIANQPGPLSEIAMHVDGRPLSLRFVGDARMPVDSIGFAGIDRSVAPSRLAGVTFPGYDVSFTATADDDPYEDNESGIYFEIAKARRLTAMERLFRAFPGDDLDGMEYRPPSMLPTVRDDRVDALAHAMRYLAPDHAALGSALGSALAAGLSRLTQHGAYGAASDFDRRCRAIGVAPSEVRRIASTLPDAAIDVLLGLESVYRREQLVEAEERAARDRG